MTTPTAPSRPFNYILEEDVSDETRALLSSLPRERGWAFKHMYLHEGSWLPAKILQGVVACQKHFQALENDTVLVTYPKCGTTWLKAMAFALTTRSTPVLDRSLLNANPHDLVPLLEEKLYGETNKLPDLSSLASPRLLATHISIGSLPRSIKDDPRVKIVYLTRNPKDTFVSMWHFYNKLRPKGPNELEDMVHRFCDGKSPYGSFWDHVLGYWKASLESPGKVLLLKYEEIKEQPAGQLRRLAEFLECPFSPSEDNRGMVGDILKLCSFDCLRKLEVNKTGQLSSGHLNNSFFRKGEVGDWKNILTPQMSQNIDRITELKLCGSQFSF